MHILLAEGLLALGAGCARRSPLLGEKLERLLDEFVKRVGDPNLGGTEKRTGIITVYRQRLQESKARDILYRDVYGRFDRVSRGVYELSPRGKHEIPLWREEAEDTISNNLTTQHNTSKQSAARGSDKARR